MTALCVRNGKREPWGGGYIPSHFDRLRWWGVRGAVEAKCEGCERSRVARWSWHGGGEGLPGVSSQDGALSRPLRNVSAICAERASGALSRPLRTPKRPWLSTSRGPWPSIPLSQNKQVVCI